MEPADFVASSPRTIIVDDREAGSPVPAALQQLPGVRVIFKRLPVGDYVIDGRCVFERKTVVDFAESIADGRLFAQATRLVSLTQLAALLLEGRSADLAAT
jgi:ERCC4-type nuclease